MRCFFLLFTLSAYLFGCNFESKPCDVAVSIPPYSFFVNELTNGELHCIPLVPPEANPHLYEATPQQVAQARKAKVWIRLGENFEKKIASALKEQPTRPIELNLAEKFILQKGGCSCSHHKALENLDLHFWMSPKLAGKQAKLIADTLIQAFPERQKQIEQNLILLIKKIQDTDLLIENQLAPFAGEAVLISHPALGYFCQDYHLKQISIEHEGKDPLPKQISAILESAKSLRIRTVFTQAQYSNKGAEMIAETLSLNTHEIDPYSANYLENLLYITNLLTQGS